MKIRLNLRGTIPKKWKKTWKAVLFEKKIRKFFDNFLKFFQWFLVIFLWPKVLTQNFFREFFKLSNPQYFCIPLYWRGPRRAWGQMMAQRLDKPVSHSYPTWRKRGRAFHKAGRGLSRGQFIRSLHSIFNHHHHPLCKPSLIWHPREWEGEDCKSLSSSRHHTVEWCQSRQQAVGIPHLESQLGLSHTTPSKDHLLILYLSIVNVNEQNQFTPH